MNIASYIDHTILKPETTREDIDRLCGEAMSAGFKAVCVPPYFVSAAKALLRESDVKVATVIGFPFGYSSVGAKLEEINAVIEDGADELDVVINITAVKNKNREYVNHEVSACVKAIHHHGKVMKLIVESGILIEEELEFCCELVKNNGIDFIKTSTGYAVVGATIEAVKTMRNLLPADIEIKASGGIRTFTFARELIDAGATRIGCSAGMQILEESRSKD